MAGEKPKRKQKRKKGEVVRLKPHIIALIAEEQILGETVSDCVERLMGITSRGERVGYVLPSDLHESLADARGAALLKSVRSKKERETPMRMRELK